MAKGNTYHCLCCGKEYTYCPKCAIIKPAYDAENFCSKAHSEIFSILSKHGCGLATAEDTLTALSNYDLNGLSESIENHIKSLKPVKTVKASKEVEAPTQEQLY